MGPKVRAAHKLLCTYKVGATIINGPTDIYAWFGHPGIQKCVSCLLRCKDV